MKIEKISLLSQRFFKVTFLYLPKKWVTHGHWGWTDTDSDECVRWALFELDHAVVSKGTFHFRLFWILFWLFGIIYTGYAVYQDTNHYLDYPSMILRKEESLGKFNDYCNLVALILSTYIFKNGQVFLGFIFVQIHCTQGWKFVKNILK